MNPSRSPDVSLYELATHLQRSPSTLQISPTTFKATVTMMLDLLLEHQMPATVWLKLPKGEVWQTEVERFCQSAIAPYRLYNLHTQQEQAGKASKRIPTEWNGLETLELEQRLTLPNGSTGVAVLEEEPSQIFNLSLSPDSQLKREYFLIVVAPEFYGVVLSHRPRSGRVKVETNGQSNSQSELHEISPLASEEQSEQKHPLFAIFSFDQAIIRQLIEGTNQAIRFGQPEARSNAEIEEMLTSWDRLIDRGISPSLNPLLLGELISKQVYRQEEIWRGGATQRKQAEASIIFRQENEELLRAMRHKDEFVKNLGQELRTPLTTMKTALSLLNSPSLKPQQRQRYMDMLSQECDRQSSLIAGVLDLVQLEGQVEPVPMEAIRLSDLVPGVVSTYQPLAQEKGLMLAYTVPEDLPPVACLSSWLRQIVINLLHNSIKFTPSGGQVWVRAKLQGDAIQMEFRDTGVGIAPSELSKVFDRFYRVRQGSGEDTGVGLGLAIVQQLLIRCGGSIAVKSKPGEGSVFSVALPIYR
ncbi:MAG: ATP-binding protein [Oculatellaceae cyanobacterium Prado106]|jgi:signal transduction histidine kinase|nr:ATP-binding protein [Oculatellaceae cyanobacterium Prado106]